MTVVGKISTNNLIIKYMHMYDKLLKIITLVFFYQQSARLQFFSTSVSLVGVEEILKR